MQYTKEHENELPPSTITVKLRKHDNFLSAASREGSDFIWYADESKKRGGQAKGASPLSYFLSSMGFCQFVHYAEHAIVDGLIGASGNRFYRDLRRPQYSMPYA
jgi:hypothetical protein